MLIVRLATAVLFPMLYLQARWIARRIPRLPEPLGAREGRTASVVHQGREPMPPIRLLVLGDSAAAGVGAGTQDAALIGRLVAELSPQGAMVWRLVARTGATATGTRRHLMKLAAQPFDAVLLSIGLNDLMIGRHPDAVFADLRWICGALERDWGARLVLVSGMPPVHRFPALPEPLRWHLGNRARALNELLHRWAAAQLGTEIVTLDDVADIADMAPDGFHPGPALYAVWAGAAAERIRRWRALPEEHRAQGASPG